MDLPSSWKGNGLPRKILLLRVALCFFVAGAGAFVLSCGDFELWGERNDGGDPDPEPTAQECDNTFPGLSSYPDPTQEEFIFGEPMALAVVPKGMTFSFVDDELGTVTVNPGDLFIVDRELGIIYLRKFSTPADQQDVIPYKEGLKKPAGIALIQLEVAGLSGITYNLLFYSQTDETREDEKGFVTVEIAGSTTSAEINKTVLLELKQATSLAVGSSGNTTGLFILGKDSDEKHKVIRVGVTISSGLPSVQGSHILLQGTTAPFYREVAFFNATGDLFVSETKIGPRIYHIQNAVTEGGTITDPEIFIDSAKFTSQLTGMTLAYRSQDEAQASLLVMNRITGSDQIQQFDARTKEQSTETYSPVGSNRYLTAIAYDCTNRRLFMTDSPETFDVSSDGLFYWAEP